jgi:signal transduction histidine kinase
MCARRSRKSIASSPTFCRRPGRILRQICKSDLNTTVEHAVMLARQQVFSKPIKIELQPATELSEVEHDSDQIHQVLLNLAAQCGASHGW